MNPEATTTAPTTPPLTRRVGDNSLPDLAERIKAEHVFIRAALAVKGLVPKAIQIGQWLNEAKAKLDHGKWLPWLKDKCDWRSDRTAVRYMRLADNKAKIDEHVKTKAIKIEDLTLTDADKIVSKAIKKKAEEEASGNANANKGNGSELPPSTQTNDDVLKLEDKLFDALKAWRKTDEDAATSDVLKFVQRLRDADLYVEN